MRLTINLCTPRIVVLGIGALVAVVLIFAISPAEAIEPGEKDARKIAQAVADRETGDKQVAHVVMTLTDASGRTRQRIMRMWALNFEGGAKTMMIFESPADVRNTGLLSIDYDGGKDDDQWLYLPSLHKTTRISTSGKAGSFVGTDISYADMTSRDVDAYDYTMVQDSVNVDGEACWLIESRPRTANEQEATGYLKTQSWISKEKLIPLQAKMWVREGKKLKYMKFGDVRKVDNIWTAHTLSVRTVKNGKVESTTVMQFKSLEFNNPSVSDSTFSERRLEQGI
jgi:outer membrane lipoprotein-sorting protein